MKISDHGYVALLLTARFGRSRDSDAMPLSVGEWALFSTWLKQTGIESSALLKGDPKYLLSDWNHHRIPLSRILALLNRGFAVGLALSHWKRVGLWVVFNGEADYPTLLERRLKDRSPLVLFGCGNRRVPQRSGIAVVGSRNANEEDLEFAKSLGATAADNGYAVISGGARGIDSAAMMGCLNHNGTAVGVLAHSLYRAALSREYREHLMSGNLTLLSAVDPEAGFTVGAAMGRNKYIYCLSDSAITVCSTRNRGGTWQGATENLKEGWVPLWVKRGVSPESGNRHLVGKGACELPGNLGDLSFLADAAVSKEMLAVDPLLAGEPPRAEAPSAAKQLPDEAAAGSLLAVMGNPEPTRPSHEF